MENPITYTLPRLVFDECFLISDNANRTFTKLRKNLDISFSSVSAKTHFDLFNIFNPSYITEQFFTSGSGFGAMRLLSASNKWSASELSQLFGGDPIIASISMMHYHARRHIKLAHNQFLEDS